jgi:hypothetical protein
MLSEVKKIIQATYRQADAIAESANAQAKAERATKGDSKASKALEELRESPGYKKMSEREKARILDHAAETKQSGRSLEAIRRVVNTKGFASLSPTERQTVFSNLAAAGDIGETTESYEKLLQDDRLTKVSQDAKTKILAEPNRYAAGFKVFRHKLTPQNREFVEKHGFEDLPNDEVRQYRDRTRALLTAVRNADNRDERISVAGHMKKLVKQAGAGDAKARLRFNALYKLLVCDEVSLTASQIVRADEFLGKTTKPSVASSRGARLAAGALARRSFQGKNGITPDAYKRIGDMLQAAGSAKTRPKNILKAVGAMIDYCAMADTHRTVSTNQAILATLAPKQKLGTYKMTTALRTIAGSKNPSKSVTKCARKVSTLLEKQKGVIKKETIEKYREGLRQEAGIGKRSACRLAAKLYEVGGPSSAGGLYLIGKALGSSRSSRPKDLTDRSFRLGVRLAKETGFSQARLDRKSIEKLFSSKKYEKTKPTLLTKAGHAVDSFSAGFQVLDTTETLLQCMKIMPQSSALVAGGSIAGAVAGGVILLSKIGFEQTRGEEDAMARARPRGRRAALDEIEYRNRMGEERLLHWKRAHMERADRTRELRGTLYGDVAGFAQGFRDTYEKFRLLGIEQRKSLLDAIRWAEGRRF